MKGARIEISRSSVKRRPSRDRRRHLIAGVATALVSLSLTLLVLEGALRLAGYQTRSAFVSLVGRTTLREPFPGVPYLLPSYSSHSECWPDNPRLYFDSDENKLEYRSNNLGFRGRDFFLRRNDAVRIVFVGDSFCWGSGVRDEDLAATLIEANLNRQSRDARSYEVLNFCLAGYGTEEEVALYRSVVQHFHPDVIVMWFFLNDVNTRSRKILDWHTATGSHWLSRWRRKSVVLDVLVAPFNRLVSSSRLRRGVHEAYQAGHPGYASVARSLDDLGRLRCEGGVQAILGIFPWLTELEGDRYPFHAAHRVVRDLAEQSGFAVLDLLPVLQGQSERELWVHEVDHHPNELAHRLVAEAMTGFLERNLPLDLQRNGPTVDSDLVPELPRFSPGQDWTLALQRAVDQGDRATRKPPQSQPRGSAATGHAAPSAVGKLGD